MSNKPPVDLCAMNRTFFEGLDPGARLELLCRLHAMTVELAERLAKNSTNSSKPPSPDSPFGGLPSKGEGGQKNDVKGSAAAKPWTPPSAPPRRPGKQPGAKGKWRCEALTGECMRTTTRTGAAPVERRSNSGMTTEDTAGISFWISSDCLAAYESLVCYIAIMWSAVLAGRKRWRAQPRVWYRP